MIKRNWSNTHVNNLVGWELESILEKVETTAKIKVGTTEHMLNNISLIEKKALEQSKQRKFIEIKNIPCVFFRHCKHIISFLLILKFVHQVLHMV